MISPPETLSYTSYKPTLLLMGSLDAGVRRFDLPAMKHGNGTYIPLIADFPIVYIYIYMYLFIYLFIYLYIPSGYLT